MGSFKDDGFIDIALESMKVKATENKIGLFNVRGMHSKLIESSQFDSMAIIICQETHYYIPWLQVTNNTTNDQSVLI
jgi:hypothetical protein